MHNLLPSVQRSFRVHPSASKELELERTQKSYHYHTLKRHGLNLEGTTKKEMKKTKGS